MGQAVLVEILDYSREESVIQPVLRVAKGVGAPSLSDLFGMVRRHLHGEKIYAACSSDDVSHI